MPVPPTSTSAPWVHHDDGLNTAASPEGLYQLALHGAPNAFRSALDCLLALTRRGELSRDQLLEALMDNSGGGQTALHAVFNPRRLDKLIILLDAVDRAADEGLLQGRHVASLILQQDSSGQAALHLFADSGEVDGENLSRLCQWMLRLVERKVLTPSDAKAILSQKSQYGRSVFYCPMVRGDDTAAGPPAALRELFKFSTSLVKIGAVNGDLVVSTLDPSALQQMVAVPMIPRLEATLHGIDPLLATGRLRRQTLMDVVNKNMRGAGEARLDVAEHPSEEALAFACMDLVADARERWFSGSRTRRSPSEGSEPFSRGDD